MNPSLYDLLDVDRDASDGVIRAAWKASIADLDPSDRRFRAYNQAAEVLLDSSKRAAYDAELAAGDDAAPEHVAAEDHRPPAATAPVAGPAGASNSAGLGSRFTTLKRRLARPTPQKAGDSAATPTRHVPAWLLIGLVVVVAALITGVVYFANQPSDT
ncbi:MAG: J domain-containing protein, partial [Nocardioides sp.]